MWLIDVYTYKLKSFFDSNMPPYAILSHTWGDDELTFQGLQNPEASTWPSFDKVRQTCQQAIQDKLDHAWIDTCCIDKSSSAELSEAINSMFRWYQSAPICYALLSDFDCSGLPPVAGMSNADALEWVTRLRACRWFERAPPDVRFYDKKWIPFSTKHDLVPQLAEVAGITGRILDWSWGIPAQAHQYRGVGLWRETLGFFSTAQRMSWWASRKTSRVEDVAYSLLGIFDINMTPLYGEGVKAFTRLQGEIVKRSTDQSIFAWQFDHGPYYTDILAEHPKQFISCSKVLVAARDNTNGSRTGFDLTNQGLRISMPVILGPEGLDWGVLDCSLADDLTGPIAICLRRTEEPNVYEPGLPDTELRTMTLPLEITDKAVQQAIVIVRPSREPCDEINASISASRINIFDPHEIAWMSWTWPVAHVQMHPPWLTGHLPGRNSPVAGLTIPDLTVSLPTSLESASGLRIGLDPARVGVLEAFCDIILQEVIDIHPYNRANDNAPRWEESRASSLEDLCTNPMTTMGEPLWQGEWSIQGDEAKVRITFAYLCFEATITPRGPDVTWLECQVDIRIAMDYGRQHFDTTIAFQPVRISSVVMPHHPMRLVARMVVRPLQARTSGVTSGSSSARATIFAHQAPSDIRGQPG
ncbi:hypothetical protein LTR56_017526 [Elasticomyces elasticus]|nr:hypothetical protein LTR56_017526 [Elasticomyces elasticus]KAK5766712.1 hypothetical protein LTS12_003061 [Elasticomyces elasticus]